MPWFALALACSKGNVHTGSISGELEFSGSACLFTVLICMFASCGLGFVTGL